MQKVVGAIVQNNNNIVLVKQTFRGFPKGSVKDNEKEEETIARKLQSECNITQYHIIKKLGNYQRKGPVTGQEKDIHIYLIKTIQDEIKSNSEDIQIVQRFDKQTIGSIIELDEDKKFFGKIYQNLL